MSDYETEADLVGDLGDDPTAGYYPPEEPVTLPPSIDPGPPPWGDDPESWTVERLAALNLPVNPPLPPGVVGPNPNPWNAAGLKRAQRAKREERAEALRVAEAAELAERHRAAAAQAVAARVAAEEERLSLVVPYSPTRPPPASGADDRSATVNRSFRLPLDVDRALRAMASYDRVSDSAELALCVNFRERILSRARDPSAAGKTWCLVDNDALDLLPVGKARAYAFELSHTPTPW